MKVIGFQEAGAPDVLTPHQIDDPVPGSGELLIRVRAATVNPTDVVRRSRGRGDGLTVPGMDVAGTVAGVGPGTDTDLAVGDEVMGIVVPEGTHGGYGELVVLPVASVVRAPRGVGPVPAATLPMNGLTARLALDTLALSPGQSLAVTGAAGALGGYVIQLARVDGLRVIADAAPEDTDLVAGLGAEVVVPRGDRFAEHVREHVSAGVDGLVDAAVLDDAAVGAVRDGGNIISLRGKDARAERDITFHPIGVVDYARERGKLDRLRELTEQGKVTLRVAHEVPAERAPEAHRRLEAGGVRGRIVLTF